MRTLTTGLCFILWSVCSLVPSLSIAADLNNSDQLGIGVLSRSNQADFERFEGAFYVSYAPYSLTNTLVSSGSNAYQTQFDGESPSQITIGVRHEIATFNRFAIFGDYGLGVSWAKGAFSANDFSVSTSSNSATLLTLSLSPKILLGYFVSDAIQPFVGIEGTFMYSRLETPFASSDEDYSEFHYGPVLGIQVLNLPFKQTFFSADWCQFVHGPTTDQRLFADNGRVELALGLNF